MSDAAFAGLRKTESSSFIVIILGRYGYEKWNSPLVVGTFSLRYFLDLF